MRMLQKTLVLLILLAGMQTAAGQPGDPLYSSQWHLKNTGQNGGTPGEDINVAPVWDKQLEGGNLVRGQDIYISIVDGDLQLDHPDLIDNISTAHNHDYYSGTDNSSHATSVAGIAAARGYNGIGVRGVAPWATIYSLNILGDSQNGISSGSARNSIDAMGRNRTITAVSNNSWGPLTPFQLIPRTAWEMAIDNGITEGFHGKGTVYVWAAGNNHRFRINSRTLIEGADSANYDAYANYHAIVAVCAVDYQGKHNGTSEFGANLWVCAPSRDDNRTAGIVTTSRPSTYTATFNGTSAATPMVSGVVALMRQVNPDLSWRDVKLILANSARQNDPMDDGWEQGALKYDSFSGESEEKYYFNHKYGFGVVNAQKAVKLAEDWTNLPDRITDTTVEDFVNRNSTNFTQTMSVQSDINFIEYIDIPVAFNIRRFTELSMKLISPSGTTSNLMIPTSQSFPITRSFSGDWRFGSARHLGEDPSGIWTLKLSARGRENVFLTKWRLRIRGYQIKIDASPAVGLSDLNINTTTMTLSLLGAKWKENLTLNDFRLKNAPVKLTIKEVATTSDTQVVQLKLQLDGSFAGDQLFEIEATTGTVSNFAKPLASNSIQLNTRIIVHKDAAIPDGLVGEPYRFTVEGLFSSPETLNYMIRGDVPPGLEISGSTISGEPGPETAGEYPLEVVATRENGISKKTSFVLRILPDPDIIGVQIKVFLEGAFVPLVNICGRTPKVENKILTLAGSSSCEAVSESRFNSITSLDLSRQGITSLKEGDFRGLSNLQTLNLSNNSLSILSSGVFTGLTNLQTLNLSNNSLSTLSSGVFTGLTNLQTLNLSNNSLSTLSSGVFTGLTNLQTLNLSNNSLSTLSSGVFTGLTNLQTLNLSNSSISSLPSGVFSELTNLQILNLNSNPVLATLSSNVFTGLDKLNELYLVGFIAITRCPTIKTELEAMGISLTTFDCRFPFR